MRGVQYPVHCKFLPHENYGDLKLPLNIMGFPPQFLQPFSGNSAGFPCKDPAIPSPCSFHGVKIAVCGDKKKYAGEMISILNNF